MEPVVEIKNATKIYKALDFWKKDRTTAISDVNLTVYKGEIFGLLGLNGAGKTTLMKVLLGLLKPTSGSIKIFGKSVDDISVRARIGYLSELPYFPKYLKVREVLEYFAAVLGIPADTVNKKIDDVLDTVRLKDKANTMVKGLSKGMQGRLGLAQAIINDPDLLFLDEPMSGLDPLGYKETRDIILALHARGKTIFFNTHILSEVEKICNRVAVLNKGVLVDVSPLKPIMKKYKSMENYFVKKVTAGVEK